MPRPAALLALHASVLLFGFAGLFAKWIAWPAVTIVLARTLVASATLGVVAAARSESARPSVALAVNGMILAAHWVSFFAAIQVASVAIGLLGFASFPLFVLVLEDRAGRRLAPREVAVALLVTLGLAVLVPSFSWHDRTLHGLALGLVSGFTFAWLAVRGRALVAHVPASAIALWQNAFAALVLAPVAWWTGALPADPAGADIARAVVLGVACTALAHTWFIASLRHVTAHVASVVAAMEPVYGIALAAWLLHEVPDARTLVGMVLIVGAAVAASRSPLPPG